MCPNRTLDGHRLDPATHEFFEIETNTVLSSSQIEGSEKMASNNIETRMQSLSL